MFRNKNVRDLQNILLLNFVFKIIIDKGLTIMQWIERGPTKISEIKFRLKCQK